MWDTWVSTKDENIDTLKYRNILFQNTVSKFTSTVLIYIENWHSYMVHFCLALKKLWLLVGSSNSTIDSSAPVEQCDLTRVQVCSSSHAQVLATIAQSKKTSFWRNAWMCVWNQSCYPLSLVTAKHQATRPGEYYLSLWPLLQVIRQEYWFKNKVSLDLKPHRIKLLHGTASLEEWKGTRDWRVWIHVKPRVIYDCT